MAATTVSGSNHHDTSPARLNAAVTSSAAPTARGTVQSSPTMKPYQNRAKSAAARAIAATLNRRLEAERLPALEADVRQRGRGIKGDEADNRDVAAGPLDPHAFE